MSNIRVTVSHRTLSDGSKVYSVFINDVDNDQRIEVPCLDEKRAIRACMKIGEAICDA